MLAFVVLMLLPPAATAAGADPSNPSLDQYVESVPTSHGGAPPPNGTTTRGHLSTSVRHQIAQRGGADATQLQAIATSPAFGAPVDAVASASGRQAGSSGSGSGATRRTTPQPAAASRPSGVDAFTTAATHGGGGSVGVLAIGLVVITLMAGGIALSRRRVGAA